MIVVGLISMNASDQWSITFGCPKTRSIEKNFIEARKTFWKRSEGNYFNRVARFNNSLSQFKFFSLFTPQKSMSVSKRNEELFGRRGSEKIQI